MVYPQELQSKIDRTRSVLMEHYQAAEQVTPVSIAVTNVSQRSYSTVVFLEVNLPEKRRLVMKNIAHHPDNAVICNQDNQAVVEYDVLSDIYPKFQEIQYCSVPRPILVIPEIETVVTEFVEGPLLCNMPGYGRHFLSRHRARLLEESYYHCGTWLRNFQGFTHETEAESDYLSKIVQQCELKLELIEKLRHPRCPEKLKGRVQALLYRELSKVSGFCGQAAGRHSDFGGWNIIVDSHGVTVIDFTGYSKQLVALDVLKMLMNFKDEENYLAYSKRHIKTLRRSFLSGFGRLPDMPEPVLVIIEALHRISSVYGSLAVQSSSVLKRIDRWRCYQDNMEWLLNDRKRRSLWRDA